MNFTAARIQQLTPSSGIFIEEIAVLHLSTAEWNIITNINLSFFSEEVEKLKQCVRDIYIIKLQIDTNIVEFAIKEPNNILIELSNMISEIENYNHQ